MKNKLAIFSDSLLIGFSSGFLTLVVLSFFVRSPIPKLLVGSFVSFLVFLFAQNYQIKRLGKLLFKKQDKANMEAMILYLKTSSKENKKSFFDKFFQNEKNSKKTFIFLNQHLSDDLLFNLSDQIHESKQKTCVIISESNIASKNAIEALEKNSSKTLEIISYEELYLRAKKAIPSELMPFSPNTITTSKKQKFITFSSSFFTRKSAIRLLFSAVVLFAYSFFVYYKVYYLSFAILLLIFSLASMTVLLSRAHTQKSTK